jgi:hypothetical protein
MLSPMPYALDLREDFVFLKDIGCACDVLRCWVQNCLMLAMRKKHSRTAAMHKMRVFGGFSGVRRRVGRKNGGFP